MRRTGGTPADEFEPWPPADRPKDRLLWVWPVVVIALTAAAGQVLGPFGVLVAGVGTTGALALYLGSGWAGRVFMLASAVVLGVALTGILLGRSYDVISDDPAQERPSRFEAPRSSLVGVDLRDADLRARAAVLGPRHGGPAWRHLRGRPSRRDPHRRVPGGRRPDRRHPRRRER